MAYTPYAPGMEIDQKMNTSQKTDTLRQAIDELEQCISLTESYVGTSIPRSGTETAQPMSPSGNIGAQRQFVRSLSQRMAIINSELAAL